MNWDPDVDGPGVIRSLDPLVRAIEAASEEDVVLFMIALARAERRLIEARADNGYRRRRE